MTVFIVAYDLNQVGQNYTCITRKLEALPYCHAQGSVWFVDWHGTASSLRDHLASCCDANDKLFVDPVSNTWAGRGMPNCGTWLNGRGL
jgi:hypothetical protein